MRRKVVVAGLVAMLAILAGCTEDASKMRRVAPTSAGSSPPADQPGQPTTEPTAQPTTEPTAQPTTEPTSEPDAGLPPVTTPYSLPVLMAEEFSSERPRRVRTVRTTESWTEHEVLYRSGDVRVSGALFVPRGEGPFPGVVLNHGYIEPSAYVTGQGLSREQEHLASAGFVVLHTDYRGHAASGPVGELSRETRLGYTRDAINAVHALKAMHVVDPDRIAMLGRSMGGGVTMNAVVAQPGLVRAAVLYSSVSSDFVDNLRRWTIPGRPDVARRLFDRFGAPRESPEFYDGLSARTYFDRITVPVLSHHGTLDDSCPLTWARTTHRLMRRADVDSRLVVHQGEQHAFGPRWLASMRTTVAFLRRHL